MSPQFEYVPIVGDESKAKLKVAYITGLSTAHDAKTHDRGRLYGKLTYSASTYTLELFSKTSRQNAEKVASGTANALETYFDLTEANSSGIGGRAIVKSYSADDSSIVLIPTFAVDHDVLVDSDAAAKMPGWDADFGFGYLHASAMRSIMTDYLPAAVPHLFGGIGLAAFVPQSPDAELPSLKKIACPDQLRVAHASLVKALSAEQMEHMAEFADIAKMARARFQEAMQRLALANTVDEDEGEDEPAQGPTVTTFIRG